MTENMGLCCSIMGKPKTRRQNDKNSHTFPINLIRTAAFGKLQQLH